jgi:molybdopterin-guanine dinucleotide biosynthesis protein A
MTFSVNGLILAGGRSQRMGVDKAGIVLAGKTLLQRCIETLRPQVSELAISSNKPCAAVQSCNLPVLADRISGYLGPLAGIHAGLCHWPGDYVLAVAVDLPFLPADLLDRLSRAKVPGKCSYAYTDDGHALAILCPPGSHEILADTLAHNQRSVKNWLKVYGTAVHFNKMETSDLGFNINTPEDLAMAEARLKN